ncbi:putative Tetratricopeptide repeat (TPR)-like superfamily protein [Hibiscus syriacus]|uniref:Tetratricopeptide repeat (TPR)-like superfamily protein n=1 Tax=Hibiscus syriacus TaxID=106335 RepID=A0A6A3BH31_HIBSY|nr:uncharacterized protein LOC120218558 [Hibiscus syriacus]KAE8714322.1 putative Tetratricopeptide repeat (TPR)-like superfamily protein [Hibiscus syriacus]
MAPHPPFKQSAITPLPLPSPLTPFSSQQNMFDPSKEHPDSFVTLSDHLRFSNSYGGYDGHSLNNDSKPTKTAQNHANYSSWNDESGISSPPLWKTSPQHENRTDYRCLSPSSRAQAIARGQRELMEMVSKMPESCYELTLKDLVEHQQQPVVDEPKEESFAGGRSSSYKSERQNSRKQQINRSGSLDNGGFLLKMVFPVSLGSKKKKNIINNNKNDCNTSNKSKVSPKPTVADASAKTTEKDWWKKRSGSSESNSGGSTINSGGTKSSRSSSSSSGGSGRSNNGRSISSTTNHRHRRKGCLAFIFCRKTKTPL